MRCPSCHSPKTQVRDSQSSPSSPQTRRKRTCINCSNNFFTLEKPENSTHTQNLSVKKRNTTQQPLNLQKITQSLAIALAQQTSPKTTTTITETILQNLQTYAQQNNTQTIPANIIASQIQQQLRSYNFAAYLRYTSAQQNLCTLQEIQEFLAAEQATTPHNASNPFENPPSA